MTTATLAETVPLPKASERPLPADLLLVRLLAKTEKPLAPSVLEKSLQTFFRKPPSREEWKQTIAQLRFEEFLDPKKLVLTEAGRRPCFVK